MAELIVYFSDNNTGYDGSNPDYDLLRTTDMNSGGQFIYKAQINLNTDSTDHMYCMVFNPSMENDNYTMTFDEIELVGLNTAEELGTGDIQFLIYEIQGTQPTIQAGDLILSNIKANYYPEQVQYLQNGVCKLRFLPLEGRDDNKLSFDPSTNRGSYFVFGLRIRTPHNGAIYVYKFNTLGSEYKAVNEESGFNCQVFASNESLTGTYYQFQADTYVIDAVIGDQTNIKMGGFVLNFYGSFTAPNPVCFHGNSLVHTDNGVVYAKHITEEHKLTDGTNFYSISKVLKSSNCTNLVHIPKHSINKDQPYSDFYVTRTHMIKVGDEEYQAQELVDKYEGLKIIELENPCNVYSFITEKGDYVKINGLNVKTFNSGEFINY